MDNCIQALCATGKGYQEAYLAFHSSANGEHGLYCLVLTSVVSCRFPNGLALLPLPFYLPLGIVVMVIRIFFIAQLYVVLLLVPKSWMIRRYGQLYENGLCMKVSSKIWHVVMFYKCILQIAVTCIWRPVWFDCNSARSGISSQAAM